MSFYNNGGPAFLNSNVVYYPGFTLRRPRGQSEDLVRLLEGHKTSNIQQEREPTCNTVSIPTRPKKSLKWIHGEVGQQTQGRPRLSEFVPNTAFLSSTYLLKPISDGLVL